MENKNNELNLKEIQRIQMELLKDFIQICDQNDFKYSLGGGSLLGCIRHQGFIPWDDDIDIMMPRIDYENFQRYCKINKTSFELFSFHEDDGFYKFFVKLSHPGTVIEESVNKIPENLGVAIDIFPIDKLGDSFEEAKKFVRKTMFQREILNAANWKVYKRSNTKGLKYEPIRLIFFVLSRLIPVKKIMNKVENINRILEFENTTYSGCIYGSYREKEIMSSEIFENYSKKLFENLEVSIISRYDEYLTNIYGNYMELPPKEKQVTHHTYKAYKVDNNEKK